MTAKSDIGHMKHTNAGGQRHRPPVHNKPVGSARSGSFRVRAACSCTRKAGRAGAATEKCVHVRACVHVCVNVCLARVAQIARKDGADPHLNGLFKAAHGLVVLFVQAVVVSRSTTRDWGVQIHFCQLLHTQRHKDNESGCNQSSCRNRQA